MCYRDNVPPLDFAGIHTACICGNNGNGKSTLIDAVTWALWGKSRATKSDDELIYQGQTEMEVIFDFTSGGQLYRVVRKHARPKRRTISGQTILELQAADNSGFRAISGDSINQTQKKITSILRMDYNTFSNSALLRQGHADEFTVKRPVERKQVLSEILGFSLYDELETKARELARHLDAEAAQLESTIKDIDETLAQKPGFVALFRQAETELVHLEKDVKEHEVVLNDLRQKKDRMENKKAHLDQLQARMEEKGRERERWSVQLRQHKLRVDECEGLICKRPEIEEGFTRFHQAKRTSDELEQKFRYRAALNERRHALENRVLRASQELLNEHAVVESQIERLKTSFQKLPELRQELHQAQLDFNLLAEQEKDLLQKRQLSQALQTEINLLQSNTARLTREIEEIEEKLRLLFTESNAHCPLCETELGEEGRRRIQTGYEKERQDKSSLLESNQATLAAKQIELKNREGVLVHTETGLNRDKATAHSRQAVTQKQVSEAQEAGANLEEQKKKLEEIEECLARKEFAVSEQALLMKIESEMAGLAYDPLRHEDVRQQIATLGQFEEQKRKLEEADRLIIQEKEAVTLAGQAMFELERSFEIDCKSRDELLGELESLPQLTESFSREEAQHREMVARQKEAQAAMWRAQERLQYCSELEAKKKDKEKLLAQASKEESIYRELGQAFGKNGIQALLIEMVLPEIEAEANRLLGRMTDNRMHIKIETQRETKKGDAVETLDIKTADELGTRSYEMFSGGEAFRINFAIRIALSRLLARRAGAPLPTLIIDEGFGTQDNAGLEKLQEAITSIQDDFEMIMVISHIDEVKDAFPVRIIVTKTPEGSQIEVG